MEAEKSPEKTSDSLPKVIARAGLIAAFGLAALLPVLELVAPKPAAVPETAETAAPTDSAGAGVGSASEETIVLEEGLKPMALDYTAYKVVQGDTIGEIAERFGLTQDTILSCNGIKNSRLLQIGQTLYIPNQDGIRIALKGDDTLETLAERYEIDAEAIRIANRIPPGEQAAAGTVFLPAARLSRLDLQEINGDLFSWPVRGYVSSTYGYRTSPFTGVRQFHSGLDIAAPYGTTVRAAMAGKVTATGFDVNSGNYVVISHHSGYRSFYGHLDVISVSVGANLKAGQKVGEVGSTGLSTGSHLHFSVYKNGVTVNPRYVMN